MPVMVQIHVNENLYLRDPEGTELGKKIISEGIELIKELGFQDFTFKKLAERIESTEASVYRYFRSKQHLLQYLVAWYWLWLEYVITFKTNNIEDPKKKLKIAIDVLIDSDTYDPAFLHINEKSLFHIIVAESARVYMTRQEKDVKGKDLFEGYDQLCKMLIGFIKEINPKYPHVIKLTSTLISAVHQQVFFSEHFPNSARFKGKKGDRKEVVKFANDFVFSLLKA